MPRLWCSMSPARVCSRGGLVLALPVKAVLVDPVVEGSGGPRPLPCLFSVTNRMCMLRLEHHVAGVPVARIEGLAEQGRDLFAHEVFADDQVERIDHAPQARERAHLVGRGQVLVVRVVGL